MTMSKKDFTIASIIRPIKISISIVPMGTVRMTAGMVKRIKWYQADDPKARKVKQYLGYKEQIAWAARTNHKGEPMDGPIYLALTFHMPMPESWSAKKKERMNGQPHTTKPDRDNLEKGVCDAFNKIIWRDDGQVCDGPTRKLYSFEPRIEVEIREVS